MIKIRGMNEYAVYEFYMWTKHKYGMTEKDFEEASRNDDTLNELLDSYYTACYGDRYE